MLSLGLPVYTFEAGTIVTGTAYATPAKFCAITWQCTYSNTGGTVQMDLQGSFNGSTWFLIDSSIVALGEIRTIQTAVPFVRAFLINKSTGGTHTVILVAKEIGIRVINPDNLDNSQQLLVGDGTLALPAYSFLNDPDTGIRRSADGSVDIIGNGISRVSFINGIINLPTDTFLSWISKLLISAPFASILKLVNTANTVGVLLDFTTANLIKIKNLTNTAGGYLNVGPDARVGGVLSVQSTAVANVGTAETDLMSFILPAGILDVDNKSVKITAWGATAANANLKTLKLYFGANISASSHSFTFNNSSWELSAIVVRTGATSQIAIEKILISTNTPTLVQTILSQVLANAITIKMTGQSAVASGDITCQGMIVELLP